MSLVNAITRCVMAATAAEVLRHFPNLSKDVTPQELRSQIMSAVQHIPGDLRAAPNNDIGMVCQRLQDMASELHRHDTTLSNEALATQALRASDRAQQDITELAYRLAERMTGQLAYLRERDQLPAAARSLSDRVTALMPAAQAKVNPKPEIVVVGMGRLEELAYQMAVRYHAQEVANVMRDDTYASYYMTALTSRMSGKLAEVTLSAPQRETLVRETGGSPAMETLLSPIKYQGVVLHLRNILTAEEADRLNVEETVDTVDALSLAAEKMLTLRSDGLPMAALQQVAHTVQADMWLAHAALLTLFHTRYRGVVVMPDGGSSNRVQVQKASLEALAEAGVDIAGLATIQRYMRDRGIKLVLPKVADIIEIYPRAAAEIARLDALDRHTEASSKQAVAVEAFIAAADIHFDTGVVPSADRSAHQRYRDIVAAKAAAGVPTLDLATEYLVGMSGSQQLQELYADMTSRLRDMLDKAVGSVHTSDLNTVVCRTVVEAVCRHLRRNALV